MGHNFTIALLACAVIGISSQAGAAVDGQVGRISQGSLRISLNVAPQVQVSNLTDIILARDGQEIATSRSEICIYSRTGQYQLKAQGSGLDASFKLTQADTEANDWSYQLKYDDGSGVRPLTSGVPLSGLGGADPASVTCGTTGLNGQLQISSQPTNGHQPHPGRYTGTLTLLVAPE